MEEIFLNLPEWRRNKRRSAGDYKMIGRTDGGRHLTIIVRVLPESRELRAVTGWDS